MKISTTRDKLTTILSVTLLIVLWKIVSLVVASDFVIPSPEATFSTLVKIILSDNFALIVIHTVLRGLLGFFISFIFGLVVGILAGLNRTVYFLINPVLVTIRAIPVISIILLALIWFTTDMVPVFIGFLIMFPIICVNVIEGIKSVDRDILDMCKTYNISIFRIVLEVYLPAITPFIIGGVSNAVGIGWKAIIASEVLSQPHYAIGTLMHTAQAYLLLVEVLAWTIIAVLISYIFEVLIRIIEKKAIVWR